MALTQQRPSEVYSDFKVNFDAHPVKNNLVRITNADAVKRALKNLCLTAPYERFYDPQYGAGIRAMLFELADSTTNSVIKDKILSAIAKYEPRVEPLDISVVGAPYTNEVTITITFALINIAEPQTVNITLERVR